MNRIDTDAYLSQMHERHFETSKIIEPTDPDAYGDAIRDEEAQNE